MKQFTYVFIALFVVFFATTNSVWSSGESEMDDEMEMMEDEMMDEEMMEEGMEMMAMVEDLPATLKCDGSACKSVTTLYTVGQSVGGYIAPGLLDGTGAYELNHETVRVLVNHEVGQHEGYAYQVEAADKGTFSLTGARVSYFDIDKKSLTVQGAGLAYDKIYDANGNVASDIGIFANDYAGLNRFCSANLFEEEQFGRGMGFNDRIFMTNEESGGQYDPVGGGYWALDTEGNDFWHVPALGRGGWESSTQIDTGSKDTVALILADDTSPFNADADEEKEAAPLYLYVGKKNHGGDFLDKNGLRDGTIYVWVALDSEVLSPLQFRGHGDTLEGTWKELNVAKGAPSNDGSTGFDEYGNPTQSTLWTRAERLGAFGFSRPEDASTNPNNGTQAVLASTGVDTYAVDPRTGVGADTFGVIYQIDTNFDDLSTTLTILYDGNDDATRALRSPDNLDWADDGYIYVQEDKAETKSLIGEFLFGGNAANPNEASVVRLNPANASIERIAVVDRSVLLDPTTTGTPVDTKVDDAGAWETTGILDVSTLFGRREGSLFVMVVQAHGIVKQDEHNSDSRAVGSDLKEIDQLLLLELN